MSAPHVEEIEDDLQLEPYDASKKQVSSSGNRINTVKRRRGNDDEIEGTIDPDVFYGMMQWAQRLRGLDMDMINNLQVRINDDNRNYAGLREELQKVRENLNERPSRDAMLSAIAEHVLRNSQNFLTNESANAREAERKENERLWREGFKTEVSQLIDQNLSQLRSGDASLKMEFEGVVDDKVKQMQQLVAAGGEDTKKRRKKVKERVSKLEKEMKQSKDDFSKLVNEQLTSFEKNSVSKMKSFEDLWNKQFNQNKATVDEVVSLKNRMDSLQQVVSKLGKGLDEQEKVKFNTQLRAITEKLEKLEQEPNKKYKSNELSQLTSLVNKLQSDVQKNAENYLQRKDLQKFERYIEQKNESDKIIAEQLKKVSTDFGSFLKKDDVKEMDQKLKTMDEEMDKWVKKLNYNFNLFDAVSIRSVENRKLLTELDRESKKVAKDFDSRITKLDQIVQNLQVDAEGDVSMDPGMKSRMKTVEKEIRRLQQETNSPEKLNRLSEIQHNLKNVLSRNKEQKKKIEVLEIMMEKRMKQQAKKNDAFELKNKKILDVLNEKAVGIDEKIKKQGQDLMEKYKTLNESLKETQKKKNDIFNENSREIKEIKKITDTGMKEFEKQKKKMETLEKKMIELKERSKIPSNPFVFPDDDGDDDGGGGGGGGGGGKKRKRRTPRKRTVEVIDDDEPAIKIRKRSSGGGGSGSNSIEFAPVINVAPTITAEPAFETRFEPEFNPRFKNLKARERSSKLFNSRRSMDIFSNPNAFASSAVGLTPVSSSGGGGGGSGNISPTAKKGRGGRTLYQCPRCHSITTAAGHSQSKCDSIMNRKLSNKSGGRKRVLKIPKKKGGSKRKRVKGGSKKEKIKKIFKSYQGTLSKLENL